MAFDHFFIRYHSRNFHKNPIQIPYETKVIPHGKIIFLGRNYETKKIF